MDYSKHYDALINKAKERILETYTEKHHIVPRCMGGSDDNNNLVALTPEEHYVAHQLLCKMYPDNPLLAKAAMMMTVNRSSNKIYGWLRRRHSKAMSISQTGERNSQFGKSWYHNPTTRERKKFFENDVPLGWNKGRSIMVEKTCIVCNSLFTDAETNNAKCCSKKCRSTRKSICMVGNKPPNTIDLTEDQVFELVNRYRNGESVSKIHSDYGIGQRKAYYVIKNYMG